LGNSYETILVERRGAVAIVTINRPEKRNALNIQTRAEGAAVLDELRADDSVRVVVLTGAGDKAFIAGADIAEFAERTALQQREVMLDRSLFNAIDGFPKPIIAMVNGYCLGGGCEVALACDLRIASDKASFGQPEINLGIIPGGGGTQRLTRLVGEGKAMEMILSGDIINAETALSIGLANHVVPADQLETKTMEIANRMAEKSPIALRLPACVSCRHHRAIDVPRRSVLRPAPGLVAPGYLRGIEDVVLLNVTSVPRLSFRLPGVPPPQCRVVLRGQHDIELSTNLDTVIVDADEGQLILLWRAYALAAGGPHDVKAVEVTAAD